MLDKIKSILSEDFEAEYMERPNDLSGLPEEELVIANSLHPFYALDFKAGRVCARMLLEKFGYRGPLLKGKNGEPLWPEGITGSITHSKGKTIAVVGRETNEIKSIGIDLLDITEIDDSIKDTVITKIERETNDEDIDIATYFCAKEATYKAFFPLRKRFLAFNDIHIILSKKAKDYDALIENEKIKLYGKYIFFETFIFAVSWIKTSTN